MSWWWERVGLVCAIKQQHLQLSSFLSSPRITHVVGTCLPSPSDGSMTVCVRSCVWSCCTSMFRSTVRAVGTFRLKLFGSCWERLRACEREMENIKVKAQIRRKKTKAPLWLNLLRRGIETDHKQRCVCVCVFAPAWSDRYRKWKKISVRFWKTRSRVRIHKCAAFAVNACVRDKQISVCISIHAAQCVWLDIYSVLQCMIKCSLKPWLYATLRPGPCNPNNTHR